MNKRKAAASAIFTDKGFYAILTASVIMVCVAAYLALSWEQPPEEKPPENTVLSSDEVLEKDYVPDWPKEFDSTTAGTTETDVKDNVTAVTEEEIPDEKAPLEFIQPVSEENIISVQSFSGSTPVFSESLGDWRLHQGIDFITEGPCDVYAAAEGTVEDVYDDGLMGTTVLILHEDGTRTLYQSLEVNPEVIKGMSVTCGQVIGRTGNTASSEALLGYHLHYAVIKDGAYIEP